MNSLVYIGETWHCRYRPTKHQFRYPLYFFGLNLDQLDQLDSWLFKYNQPGIFTVRDQDYLDRSPTALKEKAIKLIVSKEQKSVTKIMLITSPRFFGYVFNPVSFYLGLNEQDDLQCMIAEVNNTFGERHRYFLGTELLSREGAFTRFTFPKKFFVSPFFGVDGDYEILYRRDAKQIDIRVNLFQDGEIVFNSRLHGVGKPLTATNCLQTLLRFPLSGWLTMARIHLQALKLYFLRRLPLLYKGPAHPDTVDLGSTSIWCRVRSYFLPASKDGAKKFKSNV